MMEPLEGPWHWGSWAANRSSSGRKEYIDSIRTNNKARISGTVSAQKGLTDLTGSLQACNGYVILTVLSGQEALMYWHPTSFELDVVLLMDLSAKGYGFKRIAGEYTKGTGEYISHVTARARLVDG